MEEFERQLTEHETQFSVKIEDKMNIVKAEWPKNVLSYMLTPRPKQSLLGTLTRSRTTLYVPSKRDFESSPSDVRKRSLSPGSVKSDHMSDEVFLRHKPEKETPKMFSRSRLSLFSGATVDAKRTAPIMAFGDENKTNQRPMTTIVIITDDKKHHKKTNSEVSDIIDTFVEGPSVIEITHTPLSKKKAESNVNLSTLSARSDKGGKALNVDDSAA